MKTLGEKIKDIRVGKSMSQADIAHELDISINSFSRIERDLTDVNFSRLEQIAKALKVSVVQILLHGEKDKINKEQEKIIKENEKLKATLEKKDTELRKTEKELLNKEKEINALQKKLLKFAEGKN